jgi:hypothetical protein
MAFQLFARREGQPPQRLRVELDALALLRNAVAAITGTREQMERRPSSALQDSDVTPHGDDPIVSLRGTDSEGESDILSLRAMGDGGGADPDCDPGKMCWDEDKGWTQGKGGYKHALVTTIALGIITTVAFLYELLKGAIEVNWSRFPDMPGPDGDVIDFSETEGTPGMLTVTMTLGTGINWWKAAEIYDRSGSGRLLGTAWCKRDEGVVTNTTTVPTGEAGFLVLKKAKTLGVHTSMYVLRDLASKDGRSITFTWTAGD